MASLYVNVPQAVVLCSKKMEALSTARNCIQQQQYNFNYIIKMFKFFKLHMNHYKQFC